MSKACRDAIQEALPRYMFLLRLHPIASRRTVELLRKAARLDEGVALASAREFLADLNWRYHLIAAVLVLSASPSDETMSGVWRAFDRASWASPQLAVVAFKSDPDFDQNALSRVEDGVRQLGNGSPSPARNSAKALAALVALASERPSIQGRVSAELDGPLLENLARADSSHGDRLALEWLEGWAALASAT